MADFVCGFDCKAAEFLLLFPLHIVRREYCLEQYKNANIYFREMTYTRNELSS